MFLLLSTEPAAKAAEQAEQAPILVRLVNQYFGEWAYNFEMKYTYPKFWQKVAGEVRHDAGSPVWALHS